MNGTYGSRRVLLAPGAAFFEPRLEASRARAKNSVNE
jgi:hypothetical protein